MKKLAKAFTLAEVLISLAIIGTIASVTLPTLNNNIQQQVVETGLAKAINTLETVNQKVLLEKNTKSLARAYNQNTSEDNFDYRLYYQLIAPYMDGTYRENTPNMQIDGSRYSRRSITTKDGIRYSHTTGTIAGLAANAPNKYYGRYFVVLIDTNGPKGPNRTGKDIFFVKIDMYGAVIPWGSTQDAEYSNTAQIPWERSCPSKKSQKPTDARACTGAIVDNGYKILYGYNTL